jgi:RhtB (resistance to homoserine/threonine) family protein
MELLPTLAVLSLGFVAMISPGPDFLCVLRNALGHGFKTGAYTSIGIALGLYVHVAYCMVGLAVVIASSVVLFSVIKMLGAAYLLYLAYQSFRSKGWKDTDIQADTAPALTPRKAIMQGFLTNALNPKATLFFLALFTQVIDPHTPLGVQFSYGVMLSVMAWLWFTAVSLVMTRPVIRARFAKVSVWIDRTCGGLFVALAAKLALSRH